MSKSRYTTLLGKPATRRIKWFQPKAIWEKNGVPYINVFIVLRLHEGKMELFAVSAQLGIDSRGNHVLPTSAVVPHNPEWFDQRIGTAIYHVGAPVGKLQEAGEDMAAWATTQLQNQWAFSPNASKLKLAEGGAIDAHHINSLKEVTP